MLDAPSANFHVDDILVSRTDGRGVITAANETFQRVSGFTREELIGAPHKLVRHPDMPRAIFFLLWETLKRGEPISAVVKNKTKAGGHYWVLANIVPVRGGYMSVRTKPSAELLEIVAPLYSAVRAAELEDGLDPEASLELVMSAIRGLGHHGYWDFMARVGAEQWIERNGACGRPLDPEVENLLGVLVEWRDMLTLCDTVLQRHYQFETSPANMRIQASRLGTSGRALDIIASSFNDLARNIRTSMEQFVRQVEDLSGTIRRGTYLTCLERLSTEAMDLLKAEVTHGAGTQDDLARMEADSHDLALQAQNWMHRVRREGEVFSKELLLTKRNLAGLSVTRVMSAIENAQIRSGSVASIIDELKEFQEFSDRSLAQVQDGILKMQRKRTAQSV